MARLARIPRLPPGAALDVMTRDYRHRRFDRRHPTLKNHKPMDLPIYSRQAIRERVARNLLNFPDEGEAGAIRRTAQQICFMEESVREVLAFVEEEVL